MADRRSLLSRFWPPSASRRPSTTQTAAAPPPPTTSKRTPQYQSSSPTSSPPPPRAETKKTPVPTTPPRGETKTPKTQPRKASSSADSKEEPKTSSPSRLTTPSPSSLKPSSPSRFSSQSRSPPQPSSSPQSRSTFPSPSRVGSTPKRASKPPSPSPSPSPKGNSPSKDLMQPTDKISTSYEAPILASTKGDDPKLAASRQEAEVRPDRKNNVAHGQTPEETSFKQDGIDGGEDEARIKSEVKSGETKEVKEVVQETKNEANEETKKKVNDSVAPESVSEAKILKEAENPNEAKQNHSRKQEATNTNEILSTPTTPLRKSKNSGAPDKFALSNEEHVPLQKNIRDEMSKFTNKLAAGDHKKAASDSESAVSVITLMKALKRPLMERKSFNGKSPKMRDPRKIKQRRHMLTTMHKRLTTPSCSTVP